MATNPKMKEIGTPTTANEEFLDASLRHQVGVRNYASGEVNRMMEILEKADAELSIKLRNSLKNIAGRNIDFKSQRFQGILRSIRDMRTDLMGQLRLKLKDQLIEFGKLETQFEIEMMKSSLPFEVSLVSVPAETVRALVTTQPFSGGAAAARTLNQWFNALAKADQARIVESIQLGMVQGETVQSMVQRIIGTSAKGYADGVLATSRRNAEAIVRTAVNHVSNAARGEVWDANADIIAGLKWVATLDGRTTPVCRARDGHVTPLPGKDDTLPSNLPRLKPASARPPAHPNCRSVMVAILEGEDLAETLGERPFVRDTQTGRQREVSFRQKAKDSIGHDKWDEMTPKQRNAAVRQTRANWGSKVVGRVPNDVNYNDWLARQPATFQDQVLGPTKAKLFRTGKIKMDQFVDVKGNELTLAELAKQNPSAFTKAGLDPSEF